MKAKTKRRLGHLVRRKNIVKKATARRIGRSVFVGLVSACTASLAYAISTTHPTVDVNVHSALNGRTLAVPAVTVASTVPAPVITGGANQTGRGSWYALGLLAPDAITCASRTFPRGSLLQVTNLKNGRKVTCLVNDYGPAAWTGRVIDLSRGSFEQVDSLSVGTIPVEIRLVNGNGQSFWQNSALVNADTGYNRCRERYSDDYCEDHRQQATP